MMAYRRYVNIVCTTAVCTLQFALARTSAGVGKCTWRLQQRSSFIDVCNNRHDNRTLYMTPTACKL